MPCSKVQSRYPLATSCKTHTQRQTFWTLAILWRHCGWGTQSVWRTTAEHHAIRPLLVDDTHRQRCLKCKKTSEPSKTEAWQLASCISEAAVSGEGEGAGAGAGGVLRLDTGIGAVVAPVQSSTFTGLPPQLRATALGCQNSALELRTSL